ncbi:nonribosomal peptide synthase [Colletotrichum tofieldiae]|nr:nonribosomal peptide synthase [Colletotrichum tofieldiae]
MAEIWGDRTLINGYGPSECPVAQGVKGEICISGEQVTRGYWGVSGQNNKERHVPNPFASSSAQQLMYRTGDLGYWDGEMNLNHVGRIDNQVKVRGFRVELEEIEHDISTAADLDPKVQSAVVMVVNDDPKGQSEDGKRLVGSVTPQDVDLAALRSKIAAVLPGHMRPSQMMALSELPMTSNYKADRRKLANLAVSQWSGTSCSASDDAIQNGDRRNGETVLTATERMISEVWKELLHLDPNAPMQRDQDFLTMEGNSILAIKAARKLASSTGRHIPVALLLRTTVLEELARAIHQYETPSLDTKPKTQSFSAYISSQDEKNVQNVTRSNPAPLSYMEEELFYSHTESGTRSALNTVIHFTLTGAINTKALAESFKAVQRENSIMRARYAVDAQGHPCRFTTEDVASAQCVDGDQWDDEKMQALADAPFDLTRDQLVRMVIWDRSNDSVGRDGAVKAMEITLITHHIITDRASLLLVLQSMSRHYRRTIAAQSMPTSIQQSSKIDYGAWARWLQTHQQEAQTQMQVNKKLAFWKETLISLKHIHVLPRNHLSGPNGQPKQMKEANLGSSRHICIQPPTEAPDTYSQRLAVAATALALRAVFAPSSGITLAIPYMNRDDPATADMLGLFVDRLPVRLVLKQEDLVTAAGLLNAVRSATHNAVEHRAPYAQIRSQFAPPPSEDTHGHHFIDVLVIYNWRSDALETALGLGTEVRVAQLSGARAARPRDAMFPLSKTGAGGPRRVQSGFGAGCGCGRACGVAPPGD